jgi:hypothetical protein
MSEAQLRAIAGSNLAVLAQHLGVAELALDENNTCIVSVDDKYTLLITVDFTTQRLYLYSTLATHVPRSPEVKLRLYEFLLEGALLGRDMCGGGVGLSLKNDFVLMSTSLFLPLAAPTALRAIAPRFVEALIVWRARVREILAAEGESVTVTSSGEAGGAPVADDVNVSITSLLASVPRHQHAAATSQQQFHQKQQQLYQQQQQQQQAYYSAASVAAQHQHGGRGGHHQYQSMMSPTAAAGISGGGERPIVGVEVTEVAPQPGGASPASPSSAQPLGVLVVASKGPAARAGILPGDVIRYVNGTPIVTLVAFQKAVRALIPNSSAVFGLLRIGAAVNVTLLVGSAPRATVATAAAASSSR